MKIHQLLHKEMGLGILGWPVLPIPFPQEPGFLQALNTLDSPRDLGSTRSYLTGVLIDRALSPKLSGHAGAQGQTQPQCLLAQTGKRRVL